MRDYRWTETVKRTIRLEFDAPVEAKEVGVAMVWIGQKFEELNGRIATADNDWWLEPTDEGVAFVFEVTKTQSASAEETP